MGSCRARSARGTAQPGRRQQSDQARRGHRTAPHHGNGSRHQRPHSQHAPKLMTIPSMGAAPRQQHGFASMMVENPLWRQPDFQNAISGCAAAPHVHRETHHADPITTPDTMMTTVIPSRH